MYKCNVYFKKAELGGESMYVGWGWSDQVIVVAILSDMTSDCGGAAEPIDDVHI